MVPPLTRSVWQLPTRLRLLSRCWKRLSRTRIFVIGYRVRRMALPTLYSKVRWNRMLGRSTTRQIMTRLLVPLVVPCSRSRTNPPINHRVSTSCGCSVGQSGTQSASRVPWYRSLCPCSIGLDSGSRWVRLIVFVVSVRLLIVRVACGRLARSSLVPVRLRVCPLLCRKLRVKVMEKSRLTLWFVI